MFYWLFVMSDGEMWEIKQERPWHEPGDSESGVSAIRIVSVVVFVAIFLILIGIPLCDPIIFLTAVAFFSFFGLICGFLNRGLVRSLRGKS